MTGEMDRRAALALMAGGLALPLSRARAAEGFGTDVEGVLPDLDFSLTRASDGAAVTEADYRGQVVALFFGYTFCPDICPMTLGNLSRVVSALGEDAGRVTILFVTVDPARDTAEALGEYVAAFTPRAQGLRGTPDQLIDVTRRYRVTYKIDPHEEGAQDYGVSHGRTVYVFDAKGEARRLWTRFDGADADIAGAAADLRALIPSA